MHGDLANPVRASLPPPIGRFPVAMPHNYQFDDQSNTSIGPTARARTRRPPREKAMHASNLALPLTQPQAANTTVSKRLPSPHLLKQQMPLSTELAQQVHAHRQAIRAILEGRDERLLVIVGPCSIHDPRSALEYADRLAALNHEVGDKLLLVMRAYVEKPRTTVGWKGLAYDPHLDGSDDMHAGIALSRG
jgi:3-deoxy-7-phosphoheptulonate synthase